MTIIFFNVVFLNTMEKISMHIKKREKMSTPQVLASEIVKNDCKKVDSSTLPPQNENWLNFFSKK